MILTCLISAVLSAQSPAFPQSDVFQYADLGFDRAVFRIEGLYSHQANAMRINDDLISKQGIIPSPTPGYVFHSRVIVEAESSQQVQNFANYIGESMVSELAGAPGFYLVHTNTVAQATVVWYWMG